MQLRVTDGTTTVDLAGATTGIRGVTYFPQPGDGQETVSETAEVIGAGTAAQIRSAANDLERLLGTARRRRASGLGVRVFVEYKPVTGDSLYRSELYGGRIVWSDDPGARRLKESSPVVRYGLLLERAPWWEGPETELALSSSGTGAAATGGKAITNNGSANWLQAATVDGTLPAPVRLRLAQTTNQSLFHTRLYIGVNAFGDPTTFGHMLQGEAQEAGYGTDSALANASGGQINTVTINTTGAYKAAWLLPTTMTAAGGRWFRLLMRNYPVGSGLRVTMRARLFDSTGLNQLWEGPEIAWDGSQEIIDFGAIPVPPGGWHTSFGAVMLKIWMVKDTGSTTCAIDYIALLPTDAGRYIYVAGGAFTLNSVFVIDDIEGVTYAEHGGVATPTLMPSGGPLLVFPGATNRFVIVTHAGSATSPVDAATHAYTGRMYYRPRRSTI